MNNILKTQDLYDSHNDSHFGYLGINLETREVSLYSDDERKEKGDLVYKLDTEDKDFYKEFLHNGNYKRLNLNSLSRKGQIIVISALKKHLKYNKKYNIPIIDIEKILKEIDFILEDQNEKAELKYNILSNSLIVSNIQSLLIDNETDDERQKCIDSILFGIGELKVSSIKLNEENKQIILRVGFYEEKINIEDIKACENKDRFIMISINSKRKDKQGQVLELVFNDLECREIDRNYQSVISHTYGLLLDLITDGKLREARYQEGIISFHKIMNEIIPDINLSNELLDLIENGNLDDEVYKVLNIYIEKIVEIKKQENVDITEFLSKCINYGAKINLENLLNDNILIRKIKKNLDM